MTGLLVAALIRMQEFVLFFARAAAFERADRRNRFTLPAETPNLLLDRLVADPEVFASTLRDIHDLPERTP
jgi:hypothetical protein